MQYRDWVLNNSPVSNKSKRRLIIATIIRCVIAFFILLLPHPFAALIYFIILHVIDTLDNLAAGNIHKHNLRLYSVWDKVGDFFYNVAFLLYIFIYIGYFYSLIAIIFFIIRSIGFVVYYFTEDWKMFIIFPNLSTTLLFVILAADIIFPSINDPIILLWIVIITLIASYVVEFVAHYLANRILEKSKLSSVQYLGSTVAIVAGLIIFGIVLFITIWQIFWFVNLLSLI